MISLAKSITFSITESLRRTLLQYFLVLTLAAQCFANGTPIARADSGLSISGSVTADGRTAAGATVVLLKAGDAAPAADISSMMDGQSLTKGETDSSGNFKFDGVVRGMYRLEVTFAGYVASSGVTDRRGEPIYYRPGESVHIEMVKGGVITGKVSDVSGVPLPEIPVRAVRIKDAEGRPTFDMVAPEMLALGQGWATDDRGVYRIFGLKTGSYLVSAGGGQSMMAQFAPTPYHSDAQIYYPSNSRASAVEIPVHEGVEVAAIDITYQTAAGHSISGAITGTISTKAMIDVALVLLTNASTGGLDSTGMAFGTGGGERNFSLKGVPDGQYYLIATGGFGSKEGTISEPVKVAVNGADVTGLSLALARLPEVSGTLSLAPVPKPAPDSKCKAGPETAEDLVLKLVKEAGRGGRGLPELEKIFGSEASSPDEHGAFRVTLSSGGHYHINSVLPGPQFYINSMKLAYPDKNSQPVDASSGVDVKMGQKLGGLNLLVGRDGASISGKVTTGKPGEPLPIDLEVLVVPAQSELSENLLRYGEALSEADGGFKLTNLAPGKYFLLVRRLGERQWNDPDRQPSYWDARRRKDLLAEAKAANLIVELKPCEQREKYLIAYPQTAPNKAGTVTR